MESEVAVSQRHIHHNKHTRMSYQQGVTPVMALNVLWCNAQHTEGKCHSKFTVDYLCQTMVWKKTNIILSCLDHKYLNILEYRILLQSGVLPSGKGYRSVHCYQTTGQLFFLRILNFLTHFLHTNIKKSFIFDSLIDF